MIVLNHTKEGRNHTHYLPRLIGLGKTFELWFTSRWVDAEEALEIGLVNKVVPADKLIDSVYDMAEAIARNAPTALMLTKRLGYLGVSADLNIARHYENFAQDYLYGRKDFKEAVQAFSEKRAPAFLNRSNLAVSNVRGPQEKLGDCECPW